MAESMNSDPNRSNESEDTTRVRRKSGKSQPPKQENTDRSDNKFFSFFPFKLPSLRNLFGSWRRGSLEDVEAKEGKEDRRASSPPKAKSTDNIFSDAAKETGKTAKPPRPKAPTVAGGNPPSRGPSIKSSTQSMGKQLSVSADNLISPANQLSCAASQGAISDRSVSKASTLDTSNDELDSSAELVDDFFVDKWTHIRMDNRTRSLSSSDADEAGREADFDLDVIRGTKALDVSVCKDRILIKPKGKKLTQAMQEKLKTAETEVKPANRVHLHSVAEVDEDELSNDPRRKAKKEEDAGTSSCPQSPSEEATSPLPEAPPRRKKSQGLLAAAADKSCYRKTIGIAITPSMLTGALKKTADRDGSFSRTRPAEVAPAAAAGGNALFPPLDGGSWKRRQENATVAPNGCESQGAATSNGSPAAGTGDAATVVTAAGGGGGGGSSMLKRHVLSCSEDETENNKGARPKEPPPKTRPKTRPKTMLNPIASSSSPSSSSQLSQKTD